jgi:aryl-alcohol dehydrogenase-like predicted oxidoreductase
VLAQGEDVVPIPGTKRLKYVDDNLDSVNVRLTPGELSRIDGVLPPGAASGERNHVQAMKAIDQ